MRVHHSASTSFPSAVHFKALVVTIFCLTSVFDASSDASNGYSSSAHPHIVFVLADDFGWNDIGYNNPDIKSPNIDRLAQSGVIFNYSYAQPLCSPSRSAFMTGYYPFRLGLQHLVILNNQEVCVPLDKKFLPQILKANNYATHMVGKWHLGFCKWECTPTYRGFDTFYGYYSAREDYYNKTWDGFDFRQNMEVDRSATKNYSSYQYGDRVSQIIHDHNVSKPLFLYFPIQSVHEPLQVPDNYYDMYPNVKNEGRRTFSGMVTAMDDAIGRLVASLKNKGIYEDTIIFFSSDNGGWTKNHGNNYPLRGGKFSIWEGGTRVPGFVHYPKLKQTGSHYNGLMHAVDWLPTIAEAAGINYKDPDSDGTSHWKSITSNSESPRDELVYNLDDTNPPLQGKAAIRVGDYKLIDGFPGLYNDWPKPDSALAGPRSNNSDDEHLLSSIPEGWENFKGLYDLRVDPEERNNLYKSKPDIVKRLMARLKYQRSRMVPANFPPADPESDPKNYDGVWSPGWC